MSFGGLLQPISHLARVFIKSSKSKAENTDTEILILGAILGVGSAMHAAYAYGTERKEIITVNDKYQLFRGMSMQMIKTNNDDTHYAVPSSVWFWQFKSPELWRSLEVGKTYTVQSYGWRMPLLGMFPNIVDAREIQHMPISSSELKETKEMKDIHQSFQF